MRRAALVLASFLAFPAFAAERVEFFDATLQDFVEWSSGIIGRPVVVGADVRSVPVSVFASFDGPSDLASLLEQTVRSSGLYYSDSGSAIRISAQPIPELLETETAVLQLQHLQSDFATASIQSVLSSIAVSADPDQRSAPVNVSASPTTNSVIVTASPDQIESVRKVLAEIDQPRRQVVITAVVAEVSDDDYESLGLNVGAAFGGPNHSIGVTGNALASGSGDLGLTLTFDGPTLGAFVRAIKSTGNNRILSTPQLLTLNRQSASIVVGQNVPFITGETTGAATPASDPFRTITRQDVGVTLKVRPFITPANAIELEVEQTASAVSSDLSASDIITNTRRISTTVSLVDGGGVLLGGLRSNESEGSVSAVPFLSSIPVVGRLFRFDSRRDRSTNLVVLLSARIHGQGDVVTVPDPVLPLLGVVGS
jgi:general secretion pathway protein D